MIERSRHEDAVQRLLATSPVVALLGPRQVGKSTLARVIANGWKRGPVTFFDLEDEADLRRLDEPSYALDELRGLIVIDEVQRRPNLFPALRVLADRHRRRARYLVLGSASPGLLRQSAETLAGRIAFHELTGLALDEVGAKNLQRLWLRGGFPPAYTARSVEDSARWRRTFVSTFIERDLPQLGVSVSSSALRRFWFMLAHVHGQTANWSELGRSLGVADTTVRHYLDILEGALVVSTLKPWHENLSKRQVKSPKIYVRDQGLLHTLLDIETKVQLDRHPRVGASWEGFAIQQIVEHLGARPDQCYFWATHGGAELGLLVIAGGRRHGFEIKLTDAPGVTASMHAALTDLRLDSLDVVCTSKSTYALAPRIRAIPLSRLGLDVAPLRRKR